MNVIVYVEGPSDQLAMQELLDDLLEQLKQRGVIVQFIPSGNKRELMLKIPTKLFLSQGSKYRDTVDAPLILKVVPHYSVVSEACPQCFKPFVDYLESLLN